MIAAAHPTPLARPPFVIPAKAGIQAASSLGTESGWIPAFARMTVFTVPFPA
jgi:hypothetical protein